MMKVAFLGMGVMGYPMAGHIATAGHDVTVYNRTLKKAKAWSEEHGGKFAKTPAEAAENADFVFCCVGDDPDVMAVATGVDGAIPAMKSGATFVDNSTVSSELAKKLHSFANDRNILFLDAPVSGGQAGAENGKLTVMVGGESNVYELAAPIIKCYGENIVHIGGPGMGQQAKMVNQICIAGLVQALSEGLNFAMAAGLDTKTVLKAISGGAANSWQMVNRGHTMVRGEFDFGFAVDWMRKDLRICLQEANRNGASLPVTEIVAKYYDELSEDGFGRNDTSSLIRRLR